MAQSFIAEATTSKARASDAMSRSAMISSGHRPWASRRRSPRTTPTDLAASDDATTRLACNTAPASSGGIPAATTGQSGHHTAAIRGTVTSALDHIDSPLRSAVPMQLGDRGSHIWGDETKCSVGRWKFVPSTTNAAWQTPAGCRDVEISRLQPTEPLAQSMPLTRFDGKRNVVLQLWFSSRREFDQYRASFSAS